MLSEIGHTHKDRYCMISHMGNLKKDKLVRREGKMVVTKRWGVCGGTRQLFKGPNSEGVESTRDLMHNTVNIDINILLETPTCLETESQ